MAAIPSPVDGFCNNENVIFLKVPPDVAKVGTTRLIMIPQDLVGVDPYQLGFLGFLLESLTR